MGELFARLGDREPTHVADLAHIGAAHGTERSGHAVCLRVTDHRGHPIGHMLGLGVVTAAAVALRAGVAFFAAFVGERVFDLTQERAERHMAAGLLADFAHGRVAVGFVEFQFSFRPAPIVVFGAVHHAHFDVAIRCACACAVQDATCRFDNSAFAHGSPL